MLGVEWTSDCQEMPIPTRSDLITWLELIGEQVLTNKIIPINVQKQTQSKGKRVKVARV